jgi:quinol-cytochrome oxidoreductase complex cytochrome b subunit
MNKILFSVLMFICIGMTTISAITTYLKDGNYTWQVISLIWMVTHYCAYRYITVLEKELEK